MEGFLNDRDITYKYIIDEHFLFVSDYVTFCYNNDILSRVKGVTFWVRGGDSL